MKKKLKLKRKTEIERELHGAVKRILTQVEVSVLDWLLVVVDLVGAEVTWLHLGIVVRVQYLSWVVVGHLQMVWFCLKRN